MHATCKTLTIIVLCALVSEEELVLKEVAAVTPKRKVEAFGPSQAGGSPLDSSPFGSDASSVNSFLERTEKTIKEGESIVRQGKKLLGGDDDEEMGGENAHKKRTHESVKKESDAIGYKMPFASENNPIHVLPNIPVAVRAKLHDIQGKDEREQALYFYLNEQTSRLPLELQTLVVRQTTLKRKFDLLVELLDKHGMQLGA